MEIQNCALRRRAVVHEPVPTAVALYEQEQQASWHLSEGGLAYQNHWQGSALLTTTSTLPRGRCSRDTASIPGSRCRDESKLESSVATHSQLFLSGFSYVQNLQSDFPILFFIMQPI